MQVQIQALLAAGGGETGGVTAELHMEIAKPFATSYLQWRSRKSGGICKHMQVIYKNEDRRSNSSETSVLDPVTHARRVSRHIEREYHRRIGDRGS